METQITRYEALTACLEAAGSQSKMADDLGVTQPTVWRWIKQTKQLPPEHVLSAERFYGVSKHDLRPDIYPRETMTDQAAEDRFCGIDVRRGERRTAKQRAA